MIGWLVGVALAGGFETRVVEVEIDAPPEVVWDVLVDLPAYADWNPWLIEADGLMQTGEKVDVQVVLGDSSRKASHRVDEVTPFSRLCWHDRGWFTLFARGSRCRTLAETESGGTQFRVELAITRMAAGMVEKRFGADLDQGLRTETEALRARAEKLVEAR